MADSMLDILTVRQLRDWVATNRVTVLSAATKAEMIQRIASATAGVRLDHEAIRRSVR